MNLKDQKLGRVPFSYPGAKWFCVVTNPGCQTRAELGLYSLGYRTFVPKVRKWVSHARVRKAVERPLLGRYLFVEVAEGPQSFGAVRAVDGVESMIAVQGIPTEFPSHWVEGFRRRYMAGEWDFVTPGIVRICDEEGRQLEERLNGPLPIGARVRVMEGEFADMLATVVSRGRRKLTFKVLETRTHHTMHENSVRAA